MSKPRPLHQHLKMDPSGLGAIDSDANSLPQTIPSHLDPSVSRPPVSHAVANPEEKGRHLINVMLDISWTHSDFYPVNLLGCAILFDLAQSRSCRVVKRAAHQHHAYVWPISSLKSPASCAVLYATFRPTRPSRIYTTVEMYLYVCHHSILAVPFANAIARAAASSKESITTR